MHNSNTPIGQKEAFLFYYELKLEEIKAEFEQIEKSFAWFFFIFVGWLNLVHLKFIQAKPKFFYRIPDTGTFLDILICIHWKKLKTVKKIFLEG